MISFRTTPDDKLARLFTPGPVPSPLELFSIGPLPPCVFGSSRLAWVPEEQDSDHKVTDLLAVGDKQ